MPSKISILICTYNGANRLPATFASLAQVLVPSTISAELLVVDNGSSDETASVVQACSLPNMPVRYLAEPRRGKANAYNKALANTQTDIFLCTDDDVRFPANWIDGMCEPILAGRAQAVTGGIHLAPHLERPWMERAHRWRLGSIEALDSKAPGVMYGGNMAFATAILKQVPAFDPELGPGQLGLSEEVLFSMQLVQAGYTIASAFDCSIEHWADESILLRSAFLERARRQGRSDAYIDYHWRHRAIDRPRLQFLWMVAYLNYRRAKRLNDWWGRCEGCTDWEIGLVQTVAYYQQYLVERQRPRNYTKQGLVKLKGRVRCPRRIG